ncbi:ABC transporter ATP-binding protein [Pseudodesulfovibrio sp. zrk46]|uniref:ABC transporter ATP-binding protein n=1 Tax=Pseudodesulfovibrio sp. zrk46 TaxID=2725288 RepID=UPI001449811A|nr:ABC transporter ATP-binding protein [Pseudodesulfovibrio sp. zrk46]QJB56569.1 ABC transporter ATP-binding protein [Pseudodesulfovibrio sp. zrk46]
MGHKALFRFAWALSEGYRGRLLLFVFLLLIASLLESVSITLVLPVLSAISGGSGGGSVVKMLEEMTAGIDQMTLIYSVVGILIVVMFFRFLFGLFAECYKAKLAHHIRLSLRMKMYDQYINAKYEFVQRKKHGELLHNITTEAASSGGFLVQSANMFFEGMVFLSLYTTIFFADVKIALFATGVAIVGIIVSRWLGSKYMVMIGRRLIEVQQVLTSYLSEAFSSIRDVKMLGLAPSFMGKYEKESLKFIRLAVLSVFLSAVPSNSAHVIVALAFGGLLMHYTQNVGLSPEAAIPLLGFFALAFHRLATAIMKMSTAWMTLSKKFPSLELLWKVFQGDMPREGSRERESIESIDGDIVFENVSYAYPDGANVVKDFSCTLPKGDLSVIIGKSGAGKSTLINMIVRLIDPSSGKITVGGKDINAYDIGSWRKRIGFVSQSPCLFSGTIRENMEVVGVTDEATLQEALEVAGFHEIDKQLSKGLDSEVGEGGGQVSGGQRQRIVIARALALEPDVLILDEATSALDKDNEELILANLHRYAKEKGMTVIAVSHRQAIMRFADKIIDVHALEAAPGVL